MKNNELFSEKTTILGIKAATDEDAIKILGQLLYDQGYVKETFIDNVLEREKNFSTGLPLGGVNVALPHTDAIHVIHQRIAVGVLEEPVNFRVMGNPDACIAVKLIFLLAIGNQDNQTPLLQRFAEILQDQTFIQQLVASRSERELIGYLQPLFQGVVN